MGEFDDLTPDPQPPGAQPSAPSLSADSPPGSRDGDATWSVRARRVLTDEVILEEVEPGTAQAGAVLSLHRTMQTRARLYAHQLRQLSTFFFHDSDNEGLLDEAEVTALKIAAGLRCTTVHALAQIRDAHRAVVLMPHMFEYLRRGELPEVFHLYLVRQVRRLSEDQARMVDAHMATVEIPSISQASFEKQVRLGVKYATAGTLPTPPSSARDVEILDINTETGTASLMVTGPIPEIQALAHRLDVASRAVQKAQRAGLEDGAEGPLPFDIDEDLRERGRALSLRVLRYAILTHSILDIDPVQEPASPYKILVTIPVTTMLGLDDSPAMLEGMTPIPAELARDLAAGEKTWQRILTDPLTGAHLPVDAETYQPTAQMRLQLRLRHPTCAAPGCERSTVLAAEDDHIIEYDHDHPAAGGPTSLWNLHRLCWAHHKLKTAGAIDPTRDSDDDPRTGDGSTTAGPHVTTWQIGDQIRTRTREHTDLLTPRTTDALERAWSLHQRLRDDAERLHAQEKARPHAERVAEDRTAALLKAYPNRRNRIIPPGTLAALEADAGDPPF